MCDNYWIIIILKKSDFIIKLSLFSLFWLLIVTIPGGNTVAIEPIETAQSEQLDIRKIPVFYQFKGKDSQMLLEALSSEVIEALPTYQFELFDISRTASTTIEQHIKNSRHCAITIGLAATQQVAAMRSTDKLFSLSLSRLQLDKLHQVYSRLGIFISGIYQEQSFDRQLYLSKALSPELDKVSILLDQSDKFYLPEYQRIANNFDIELDYRILHSADTPQNYLPVITAKNGYLLISNNQRLYMKAKLAGLVVSSFHQQVNLIGGQINDVKAGAIAGVYTPPYSLAVEAARAIKKLCHQDVNYMPSYATDFNVIINTQLLANRTKTHNQTDTNQYLYAEQLRKKIEEMESSMSTENHYE